ncbi:MULTISPECIES: type IV secretory system conjugative DNA transfer family protein [Bacteria]|jgi:type IV secretion system protein VirD4|uniref:Conjugal transfer protein TraG n=3 Tax=Sphingomonadaceae TaxID=41297 RepID=A0A0A1WCP0_9SPHN|nr:MULTISPECIES: type IV secretory system conjugative DNA transfer family protein [Sphingomonadaceae]MCC4254640.1 type IV secretory system conjugative DNA transfer family protein [Sphingobium naphthae]MYL99852.1 type IV secretory system conjugative DNA transfer family protein [Novosphingobium silvae]GAM02751.1 conjugal transfer protein TraG [Sphingomonas parapaucimobilis NBRC 15100]HAV81336.1 type IV secretory system conjugative DNA transfer family protein [Erythrobacter sp.]|tara:strand:- start:482 stop:2140 length:1659 start_codon:yes stop_codon:yes gene_type:complete
MEWFRQLGRAIRNLSRIARQNPIWAITALVVSPIRLIRHLFAVLILFLAAGIVLGLGMPLILGKLLGLPHDSNLYQIIMMLTVIVVILIGLRALFQPLILAYGGPAADDTHGSARFATDAENRAYAGDSGLLIGRDRKTGRPLRYAGPAHLLTIAPTRTGKGVGTIIPNLLDYAGPVVCIDPKGENARITARHRGNFGPVHVLDPFGVTGLPGAAFNPLDRIDPAGLDLADDCMTLADALVYDAPGEAGEAHWNEEAKALIAGIILAIVTSEPPATRTLATLRDRLTLAPQAFAAMLEAMQAQGGLAARAANRHLGKSDREGAGVLSAAQRHTHFLDSPRMTAVLGHSDFTFADVKAQPTSVYLVLPPDRLATYARWLRLMLAQGLTDLARAPASPTRSVLFLLDEFAALGRLEPVERAMGLMAGYGIQLWPILQDVHQLRALYERRAGTFLSNAGVLQVFGVNDHDSAKLVSDLLGQETVVFETMSRAIDAEETGISFGAQHVGRPLLTPDEVRTLREDLQLVFLAGQRPIVAAKLKYYADREFAGRFDKA